MMGWRMRGKQTVLLVCVLCLLLSGMAPAQAIEGTSYTQTISVDQSMYIPTMDAYLPAGTYLEYAGMNNPEDMFLRGRELYIADSGNHRILVYALDSGELTSFGEADLKKPTGVAVDEIGNVYVADYGAQQVVVFSANRQVIKCLTRPTEPYYGNSPYKPQKVGLDSYGNLFCISEGTYEGVIQFDKNGNFNGFFGANKTKGLNLIEWFQKTFYTEEQKSRMTFRTPPNIVSLDVANSDMVFTVTQNDPHNAVKKLNMAGVNIYPADEFFGSGNFADVAVLASGGFYAAASDGTIFEYDEDGSPLLSFGGSAQTSDRNGLTAVVSAIETDGDGNIYVLDKERGVLQVWFPTEYGLLLHRAEDSFKVGHYEESLAAWGEILRMNPMAYMSHLGYGKALFQLGRYEEAAKHFELTEHRANYSDCFWEMRSAWMRTHMEQILILAAVFAAACLALSALNRKYGWSGQLRANHLAICKKVPLVKNLTSDIGYFLKHPINGVYYIKTGERGSVAGASILYVAALAVHLVCQGLTSFVFGGGYSWYSDPVAIVLIAVVPAGLFLVGSYLISSINDGEGDFRTVYVTFAYSLSAFILCSPVLTALTHVFTLTEIFICQMLSALILGYTAVMLFISIKEVHGYNLRKTVANILLTLFFMVVSILAVIILFILWRELFSFLSEVFEEVGYRVFS